MAENEFSDAFSTAFDAISFRQDICVPDSTDWACAYTDEEIETLDPAIKARSEALAWTSLASLTGYQVATCPTMVRPCTIACNQGSYTEFPLTGSGSFRPGINPQGFWVNSCGCGKGNSCSCTTLSQVDLPGPVGGILDVLIDGFSVDPMFYRVDQGHLLVAQHGYVFPACQDMTLPETEEGTFAVRYWKGFAPNSLTNYAAGVLAAEFYKACTNAKGCRLPNGVTTITRQGVTMEIQSGLWQGGWTGIREVDAIITTFNPYGLKSPTVIVSPDGPGTRTPTWRW